MKPYATGKDWTLYHGDCLGVLPTLGAGSVDAVVTDPPYGIGYCSGKEGVLPRSIAGDSSTWVRDEAIERVVLLGSVPMLVFGTWREARPRQTRQVLVWDKGGALGMGALDIPWKPDHEEIYVIGYGWRGNWEWGAVVRHPPVQSMASNGRVHPNEKPVGLIVELLRKIALGTVLDPFTGSGTTGVACIRTGRKFIGIEIDEHYCEIAAKRMTEAEEDQALFTHQEAEVRQLTLEEVV